MQISNNSFKTTMEQMEHLEMSKTTMEHFGNFKIPTTKNERFWIFKTKSYYDDITIILRSYYDPIAIKETFQKKSENI